ncbi:RNase adapter RapZ [Pseudooceanicola sp. MF1-13]|uniref:RNase adapter RapZ n=1 Tax=Pseudooceanicola sp. MF1-13 TaxID=3379095 RepID=UPI0038922E68
MSVARKPVEHDTSPALRRVLVTGPSGAGRSTAIRALEDLGYEAIDNLPLSLVPRLIDGGSAQRPVALGIDVRNRDFSTNALIEAIDTLGADRNHPLEVLYLDCSPEVLVNRYSETRRRHPMAPAETPRDGIAIELDLLAPIRARADVLIDTTELSPHDLRAEIERWFKPADLKSLAISIHSFSYKRGLPRGIDMVLDTRFLRNPYWDESLRGMNGQDAAVQNYVASDTQFTEFFERVKGLVLMLLPAYVNEGKSYFSVAFGCTGGQHRSVTVTELLAKALAEDGWQVSIRHRELERRGAAQG